MKESIIMFVVMLTLVLTLIFFGIRPQLTKLDEFEAKCKNALGTTIIYNKDTLTVINYSLFNNTYIMSNGTEMNINLFDKLDSIN